MIGCGRYYATRKIFFTRNGKFVHYLDSKIEGKLYPQVWVKCNPQPCQQTKEGFFAKVSGFFKRLNADSKSLLSSVRFLLHPSEHVFKLETLDQSPLEDIHVSQREEVAQLIELNHARGILRFDTIETKVKGESTQRREQPVVLKVIDTERPSDALSHEFFGCLSWPSEGCVTKFRCVVLRDSFFLVENEVVVGQPSWALPRIFEGTREISSNANGELSVVLNGQWRTYVEEIKDENEDAQERKTEYRVESGSFSLEYFQNFCLERLSPNPVYVRAQGNRHNNLKGQGTVEFWMCLDQFPETEQVVWRRVPGGTLPVLEFIVTPNNYQVSLASKNKPILQWPISAEHIGAWTHVALYHNGTQWALSLNFAQVSLTVPDVGGFPGQEVAEEEEEEEKEAKSKLKEIDLGTWDLAPSFIGRLDEFRVWKVPKEGSELSGLSAVGSESNLVALWTFDEGADENSSELIWDSSPFKAHAQFVTDSGFASAISECKRVCSDAPISGGIDIKLSKTKKSSRLQLSKDCSTIIMESSSSWGAAMADMAKGFKSGKHVWEVEVVKSTTNYVGVGIATKQFNIDTYVGGDSNSWGYQASQQLWHNSNSKTYGMNFTTGDIIRVELDCGKHTLKFYKNGKDQGVAYSDLPTNVEFFPVIGCYNVGDSLKLRFTNRGSKKLKLLPVKPTKKIQTDSIRNDITTELISGGFDPIQVDRAIEELGEDPSRVISHLMTRFEVETKSVTQAENITALPGQVKECLESTVAENDPLAEIKYYHGELSIPEAIHCLLGKPSGSFLMIREPGSKSKCCLLRVTHSNRVVVIPMTFKKDKDKLTFTIPGRDCESEDTSTTLSFDSAADLISRFENSNLISNSLCVVRPGLCKNSSESELETKEADIEKEDETKKIEYNPENETFKVQESDTELENETSSTQQEESSTDKVKFGGPLALSTLVTLGESSENALAVLNARRTVIVILQQWGKYFHDIPFNMNTFGDPDNFGKFLRLVGSQKSISIIQVDTKAAATDDELSTSNIRVELKQSEPLQILRPIFLKALSINDETAFGIGRFLSHQLIYHLLRKKYVAGSQLKQFESKHDYDNNMHVKEMISMPGIFHFFSIFFSFFFC